MFVCLNVCFKDNLAVSTFVRWLVQQAQTSLVHIPPPTRPCSAPQTQVQTFGNGDGNGDSLTIPAEPRQKSPRIHLFAPFGSDFEFYSFGGVDQASKHARGRANRIAASSLLSLSIPRVPFGTNERANI